MSNLINIQFKIQKRQKQANEINPQKLNNTVQDILVKMQAFGIAVKDLQNAKQAKGAKSPCGKKPASALKPEKSSKNTGAAVAPKYRGLDGETWSGSGLTPEWLSDLIAQGQSQEPIAINAQ